MALINVEVFIFVICVFPRCNYKCARNVSIRHCNNYYFLTGK